MTKQLTRSRDDRWIAGVCGGIADYTGIDTAIVRIVLVVCTILGAGSLIVGYLVAWVLMPQRTVTDAPSTGPAPAQQWR